jgi:hypothetical protein
LSVSHHWTNLFYTLEPDGSHSIAGEEAPYEKLMERFSAYVVAAQSSIAPEDYFRYCSEWFRNDHQPERSLYSSSRLASRVASASRAMRRLSLVDYRDLFAVLSNPGSGDTLYQRVIEADQRRWSDHEQRALDAIFRLMAVVVPGMKSSGSDRSSGPRVVKEVRQKFRDGYVRVSESPCLLIQYQTEQDVVLETVVARPMTAEERFDELMRAADAEFADMDEPELTFIPKLPTIDEIQRELDGQEWMPVDDLVEDGQIDSVLLSTESADFEAGVAPGTTSRWAADHRRRHLLLHGLTPSRIGLEQVRRVLRAMYQMPPDSENGPAMACLHAAITLGRSFESATSLEIHESHPGWHLDPDRIYFVRDKGNWILSVPPPAWEDEKPNSSERTQWGQIWIRDPTDFGRLLSHFSLPADRPVKRLTGTRRKAIADWLAIQLPHSDNPLRDCTQFLTHRLLESAHGDLGIVGLITGVRHSHGGSIAHYSHYAASNVWAAYQRAWRANSPGAENRIPSSRDDTEVKGYGARRVPTPGAVKVLLKTLRDRILAGDGMNRHNDYTAYTWAGMVLGTGMRPVTDPHILNLAGNVGDQLVITYVDKARTDYHRRINVLPPRLAEHLQRYAHHLRTLDLLDRADAGSPRPCFRFQQPDGSWRPFKPSDFAACCVDFFDLELYSLRRFFRSELIADANLTGEDVDAVMGHWFDGVSPHDRLSTYPMMRLHAVARGAISQLLHRVGFRPLWIDQCGR